jgi:hypothetical protein
MPFYKFANLMEISEALTLFYRILEENKTKYESTFQALDDKRKEQKVGESSAIAAWRLHENSRAAIEKSRSETKSNEIERQRDRLNILFTNSIPFDKENLPSKVLEEALSRKIDEYGKGIKDKEHDLLLLSAYLFNKGKLEADPTILLYFYVKLKVEWYEKGVFTKEFVNATVRGAITTGTTILASGLSDPVRIVVGALGGGFFALFMKYLQDEVLPTNKGNEPHYLTFKRKFIEFIATERERLGDEFDEKYPLNVFKTADEKENDGGIPSIARFT